MTLRTALTSMFESAYVIGLIIWMVLLINFLAIGIGAIYVGAYAGPPAAIFVIAIGAGAIFNGQTTIGASIIVAGIFMGAVGSLIYHEYFTGDDDLHSMIEDARTE